MRRPPYSAVTGVTVAMAGICAVKVALQGTIPPPHPEMAGWGQGEFVRRAQNQDVAWRPLGRKAFEEAQRRTLPLLVVVGVPWSATGRQADRTFAVSDVARSLRRGFVPIRVDAAQDTRWISQFLPLQRAELGISVGFQAWVFDLKGRVIAFVGRRDAAERMDENAVVQALVDAQKTFGEAVLSDADPELEASQKRDAERLTTPQVGGLSLANAAGELIAGVDPVYGGWDVHGLVGLRPLALRFLQLAGATDDAGRSLRAAVLSSRADWLDGGFYRLLRRSDGVPEYDKAAVANAQLAEALAVQDVLRPDPLLRRSAGRAVRWLLTLRTGVLVAGAEMGDEDEAGRSRRASLTPRRLREGDLPPFARAWAEANLGPARLLVPRSAQVAADPRLDEALAALRRAAGPPRARLAPALCDVNGAVAACLLRCARLWGDADLAVVGGRMVDQIDASFRGGAGVYHVLDAPPNDVRFLSDAVAYADACLQDYLTNGRVPSLEHGADELRRALTTFGDPERGFLRTASAASTLIPGLVPLPQVTDDEGEASSSAALRLLDAYAAVLGPSAGDLARWADRLNAHLEGVTEATPSMGGALGALARHLDARAALVTGPDALAVATRLARRFPNRLVVPILGGIRPDLAASPRGIYLTTAAGAAGPFSEPSISERLPGELEVGLSVGR